MSYDSDFRSAINMIERGLGKQIAYASSVAVNKTARAFASQHMPDVMRRELRQGSSYPLKPYTLNAITQQRSEWATPDRPVTTVRLKEGAPSKGQTWYRSLAHLFTGGSRPYKRMEGAFRRIRALPDGYVMIPGRACPLDMYGNPRLGFVTQIISYFRAFGEQGFKANMTDKRKGQLARIGKTASGYKTINGVQYFVSYGRRGKPGGDRYTNGRHDQHLPAGIWARSGIHGSTVKPVFVFKRAAAYRQYLDLQGEAEQFVPDELQRQFDAAFARAIETARW